MKTNATPEQVLHFIASMPREDLERFAYLVFATVALEHDEETDPAAFIENKEHKSAADFMDIIGAHCEEVGMTPKNCAAVKLPKEGRQ